MAQVVDRQYFLWGDVRLSANARAPESHVDQKAQVRIDTAESRRIKNIGGRANGSLIVPLYDLDNPTAATVTDYNDGADRPFTWYPVATAETFALLYSAHAMGSGFFYDESIVGIHRLQLEWANGSMGAAGQVIYTDSGGVGITGAANGASVTFPKGASYTGDGISDLDFSTGPDLITRVGGSFITDGFLDGCEVVVTGSVSNNGTYNVTTVSALTLAVEETLTAEPDVAATVAQAVVKSTESMRLHFHAWQVDSGPGLFDALVESAPTDAYSSPTTRTTWTQVNSANLPGDGQSVLVAGPITDPEWRLRTTAVTAGTWFVDCAGAIVSP